MSSIELQNKASKGRTLNTSPKRRMPVIALGVAAALAALPLAPANADTNPRAPGLANTLPASFADVVEQVSPAVVNIQVTSRTTPKFTQMSEVPGNMREFFERHFGAPGGNRPGMQGPNAEKRMSAGSGFVIDADGHIVTNEHVIKDADEITVTFKDGTTAKAELVGKDDKTDLALIKIEAKKPLAHVNFGPSDNVRVGDWVVTVGNPFGLGHSVNVGIVSARGRTIGAGPYDDFLQIDAPINRGNSGGPAFDVKGNVVGVNAAIFSPNGGNVGIGFAIPSAIAKKVIAELKEDGVVERGWLGVSIQPLNDDIADGLGLKSTEGVLVSEVAEGGPADKAGLEAGDVILSVNDERIETLKELPRVIADIDPGTDNEITVWRNGKEKSFDVAIGKLPGSDKLADAQDQSEPSDAEIGLALKKMDADTARQLGLPETDEGVVVIGVKPGSPAAEKGLRAGDVLAKAGGRALNSPGEFLDHVSKARKDGRKTVLTLVKRGSHQRFIAIPVGAA